MGTQTQKANDNANCNNKYVILSIISNLPDIMMFLEP